MKIVFPGLFMRLAASMKKLKRVSGRSLSALVLLVEPEPANPFFEEHGVALDVRARSYDKRGDDYADWDREMVQRNQGFRFHPA